MKKLKNKILTDFVIIGTGNIALRHLKNLKILMPNSKIVVIKRSKSKIHQEFKKLCQIITNDIDVIFPKSNNSSAFICSATTNHVSDALILGKKQFNLFIEKPLSVNTKGIKNLINIKNDKKIKIMIGYNLRFLESVKKLKSILSKKSLGDLKHVYMYVGSNYKLWRKNISYKKSVSSQKKLGGGVINELSHEIDMMTHLFGLPNKLSSASYQSNEKEVDVEDTATSIFIYDKDRVSITIHQNMTAQKISRYSIYEFEKCTIKLDIIKNEIDIQSLQNHQNIKFKSNINDSYVNELKFFLNTKKLQITDYNFYNSINIINIIAAMKKSHQRLNKIKYV
tara:strand:- start:508 stop:1521 length:1014 start_codon:yes stop_codon:yes gene_type:complete